MSSLTDKMLAKKKVEKDAEAKNQNPAETGAASATVPVATSPEDLKANEAAAQQVAKDAGATEVPKIGAVETGMMTSILEQKDMPTEEQIQAQRTETSTNVDILETRLIGGGDNRAGLPADPPTGTLPNSGMILENEQDSVMRAREEQQRAGLNLGLNRQVDADGKPKLSDEEAERIEREAAAWADGEGRRQRMLAGRPQDTDLMHNEEDGPAPAGGFKAVGITQIAMPNGAWFKSVNGYFVPETEEQEKELDYYIRKGLVEKP